MRVKLFDLADLGVPLSERDLGPAPIVLGRGQDADWELKDPERLLSRLHCTLELEDGAVVVVDRSTNGVFIGPDRERCARGQRTTLQPGQDAYLGGYVLRIEPGDDAPTICAPTPAATPLAREADSPTDAGRYRDAEAATDASLFEAFCAGARLDVSLFSEDDPVVVMRRAGKVYREMIVGLSALMAERTTAKAEYQIDQTRVRAAGNNLFRWANPHRIGVDLLREVTEGFASGPEAVESSFGDLKSHLQSVLAGIRTALSATLGHVSPETIEARLRRRHLVGHKAAAWDEFVAAHAEVLEDSQGNPDGVAGRAFREGYAAQSTKLRA